MAKFSSVFFFGLTGIDVPFSSSPGFSVGNNFKLVNDRASVDRLISGYTDFLGSVEASFLRDRTQAFGYRRSTIESDESQISETMNGEILRGLMDVNGWLMRLWLIKDNSVNVDLGWMASVSNQRLRVSNNRYAAVVSTASGRLTTTAFTKLEIDEAGKIPLQARQWAVGAIPLNIESGQDPNATQLGSDKERFYRFMYFIHIGRATVDVPIKIAHWCSGLEALVSTSQSELSHQVAERTATALYAIGPDRMAAFKLVKQAYAIRSKAVHGAAFKSKDLNMLVDMSISLDDICRSLARKCLQDAEFSSAVEGDSQSYDRYWLAKILAGA